MKRRRFVKLEKDVAWDVVEACDHIDVIEEMIRYWVLGD